MNRCAHFLNDAKDRARAGLVLLALILAWGSGLPRCEYRAEAATADTASPTARNSNEPVDEPTGVNQDRARQAVTDGEIMALHEILTHIYRRHQGRVLEVILKDREAGLHGWVYDIRLLVPGPRVLHLRVDAGTGSILMVEGADETSKP